MPENPVVDVLMSRRSIRRFQDRNVSEEQVRAIVQAGQRAPAAGEFCSVVWVRSREKRDELEALLPRFPICRNAPVALIVCVDFNKVEKVVRLGGREMSHDSLMLFLCAVQDAALVAENIVIAAESVGLGSVFQGGVARVMEDLAPLVNLPTGVFPLVGICVGYPAEEPPVRPRIPFEYFLFEDEYRDLDELDVDRLVEHMDRGRLEEGYYTKYSGEIPPHDDLPKIKGRYGWAEHYSRKWGTRDQTAWEEGYLLGCLHRRGVLQEVVWEPIEE